MHDTRTYTNFDDKLLSVQVWRLMKFQAFPLTRIAAGATTNFPASF